MDSNFKVPSTVPQDLLLIQDLLGAFPLSTVSGERTLDSGNDCIASTDDEAQSEEEVEAGLAPCDDDSGMSAATSTSSSLSDSELDADSSEDEYSSLEQKKFQDDIVDEELGVTSIPTYLQTRNEIVDANIMVPAIFEVDPCDTLEKVGEIMNIVGDVVIVKGLPVDHVRSLPERALDVESLLVFEDRKVLGHVYETFGPTSQPLYQVKFDQNHPLDTSKIWLSRAVFHVPQRSCFVFVDELKNSRGSDASNIHDEEPADDEIEFSDDEKEAAFKAQHKRRRGRSSSYSHQTAPAWLQAYTEDMAQDRYRGSNPYDAHGPYDDDYHVTGPSRPAPVPYDDPYADIPTSDGSVHSMGVKSEFGGEHGGGGSKVSRGRILGRGTRGPKVRGHHGWSTSRRGYHHGPVASQRTFDLDTEQASQASTRTVECAIGYGQTGNTTGPCSLTPPAWLSPETNNMHSLQQSFVQPHINPRFASMFGLDLTSAPMIPWTSHDVCDHTFRPHHWIDTRKARGSASSEGEGDTYRPM